MLIIRSAEALARALTLPIDSNLKRLLRLRGEAGAAEFIIVEADDHIDVIEEGIGFPILAGIDGNNFGHPDFAICFEWILGHRGWYEACLILNDADTATVLLVPDSDGVDPQLLTLCREHCLPTG